MFVVANLVFGGWTERLPRLCGSVVDLDSSSLRSEGWWFLLFEDVVEAWAAPEPLLVLCT